MYLKFGIKMKRAPLYSLINSEAKVLSAAEFLADSSVTPARQRGAGSVEYMLITGVMVAALLTPFSTGQNAESASVLQRLMDAISGQQKAYNYSTQYPSTLNIQDIADSLGDISQDGGGGDGGNANGGGGSPNGGGGSGSGSGESDSSNGEGEGAGNGQGDDTNGGDDAANDGDGASGDGGTSGSEDGNAGENDGDVNVGGAGSGIDISWEALAATAMAMCLAKPDENPIWTEDDLIAFKAANDAYGTTFEEDKKSFEKHGIRYPIQDKADANGFSATLSRTESGQWVLAFRGSDGLNYEDWIDNNIKQAVFGQSSQYDNAVKIAADVKAVLGDDVLIAGHSLGGGLATAAAYETGLDAITFNAAGLRDSYKRETIRNVRQDEIIVTKEPGALRNHYIAGDFLTTLQTLPDALLPSADGKQIGHSAGCSNGPLDRHGLGAFSPPEKPGRERPNEYEDEQRDAA
ncbi:DUF2974 domain-containing protein [Halomonas sp. SpR1]|uniref:Mbeg1-like protein n=1 Tax=Halomonas sp. SpR1 TaxID=3050462 RepID=UPI0027E5A9B0|nr:Mbeg1-like protein [Halomonas sp. SpR1]MDQ7735550.1 DUF2974 domain-containing protein [Halomonas sp. SpR1]